MDTSKSHHFVEEWSEIFIIGGNLHVTVHSTILDDRVKDLGGIILTIRAMEKRE